MALLASPTNAAAMMLADLLLSGPGDLRPALDALDRPLPYIVKENRDDDVAVFRTHRPDAPVEILANTPHALFVDAPAEFNRVLETFLDGLASPAGTTAEPR